MKQFQELNSTVIHAFEKSRESLIDYYIRKHGQKFKEAIERIHSLMNNENVTMRTQQIYSIAFEENGIGFPSQDSNIISDFMTKTFLRFNLQATCGKPQQTNAKAIETSPTQQPKPTQENTPNDKEKVGAVVGGLLTHVVQSVGKDTGKKTEETAPPEAESKPPSEAVENLMERVFNQPFTQGLFKVMANSEAKKLRDKETATQTNSVSNAIEEAVLNRPDLNGNRHQNPARLITQAIKKAVESNSTTAKETSSGNDTGKTSSQSVPGNTSEVSSFIGDVFSGAGYPVAKKTEDKSSIQATSGSKKMSPGEVIGTQIRSAFRNVSAINQLNTAIQNPIDNNGNCDSEDKQLEKISEAMRGMSKTTE